MPLILKRSASTGTAATTKGTVMPAVDTVATSDKPEGTPTNFAAAPKAGAMPSAGSATAPESAVAPKKLVIKAAPKPQITPEVVIKEWPPVEIPPYVPHKALFLGKSPVDCTFCKHPYMQPCNGQDHECGNYAAAVLRGVHG